MATPSAIPINPPRETVKRIHRVTKEKRSLWYLLTVLQQPERARACGSGMKANSDRRPVDPPPVVELRIYEGPSIEKGKLITFEYNANFFLYASLEAARPIAHGRVQNSALNNPPILTGVPASGMAYLDKPAEAGYFIFPDLSVRHEGTYKLSFSLFEMTKEEKDYDLEPPESHLPNGVDWRMEIETAPFSVYSAKKFPGLMESTPLSRTVAEQGCRVRIRRDVRMRKRDNKSSHTERREAEYSRHRTVTPAPSDDSRALRARSASNSSEQRAQYPHDPQRRPSMADSYPPPTPSSAPYDHTPAGSRSHLNFDQPTQLYSTTCSAGPPVPISPSGPYPSAAPSPYIKAEPPNYRYQEHRTAALPPFLPSSQHIKPDPYDRRSSASTHIPPSPSGRSLDNLGCRRESHVPNGVKPLLPAPPKPQLLCRPSRSPMSITTLISDRPIEPQSSLEVRHTLPAPAQMFKAGDKRKRDETFIEHSSPLHNGSRQHDYHHREDRRDRLDVGTYKRADGSRYSMPFLV